MAYKYTNPAYFGYFFQALETFAGRKYAKYFAEVILTLLKSKCNFWLIFASFLSLLILCEGFDGELVGCQRELLS